MVFISVDDFFEKAKYCQVLTRQEEIECATRMKDGDLQAREQLIQSYTPMVAGHIKHLKPHMQQLSLVMNCMQAMEKAVDSFDFLQDSETFTHRLSWWLRQTVTEYIVK